MKEYQKISNIFKFDEKYRTIVGLNEPFKTLRNIIWQGTEKIDGTNVRVYWDGHNVQIAGRTDKSQFQGELEKYLKETFCSQEMEYVFEQLFGDKETYLFGEGYGPKIQTNGKLYSSSPNFILFDVNVDGIDLCRNDVNDIADKLGLKSVPIVFEGSLDEAINYVRNHQMSVVDERHEMEGIVLAPKNVVLYDKNHKMIKCKCKYRDII